MEPTNQEDSPTLPLLLPPSSYAGTKPSSHDELRHFRRSLRWCTLDHSSPAARSISCVVFFLFTILIPTVTSLSFTKTATCRSLTFNLLAQVPESSLASIAFLTLNSLTLLDDALLDDSPCVRRAHARKLNRAFRYLACIMLPAFSAELAHKILFFNEARPVVVVGMLASWVYRTGVFLLVCMLFRLTCELQILRFEGFHAMFEGGQGEVDVMFKEHLRIREQLMMTSHRYRGFIIGCLVTITVSQLGALMLILSSKTRKNFCNSGDIVVCSVVKLSGFFLCLFGAARITHRAQRIVSVASRWHMSLCCSPNAKSVASVPEVEPRAHHQPDASNPTSADAAPSEPSIDPNLKGVPTFGSRQALVTYLQHNGGGITLFGFALDRGLLQTLFVFEMTLVLWILGKVIVVS